jgi:dimethylargininase
MRIFMFSNAIVRTPCKNFINGLTTADLGAPDYNTALEQHQKYIEALQACGLNVTVLGPDEQYPDSTFVEDTALLIPYCAVITNPGAPSRKGEVEDMMDVLKKYFSDIYEIKEPGTLEAGDVMMVDKHFYIGLSERTNAAGSIQLINILSSHGLTGSTVSLENILHLKSGVSYIENNNLLVSKFFVNSPEFQEFNLLLVDEDESYAANSLWINDKVLIAAGFPKTKDKIANAGYKVIEVDVSEFRKLDGGLSCLSLRW